MSDPPSESAEPGSQSADAVPGRGPAETDFGTAANHLATGTGWAAWTRAILAGATGGAVAAWVGIPLAWMVGAMLACTVAAVLSLERPVLTVAVPLTLRRAMIAVLGVMLGAGFTPDLLTRVADWWSTVAGLVLYVLVSSAAAVLYCQRIGRLGQTTGFFSAMPGGLGEMMLLLDSYGGNPRVLAIMHGVRIMLLVITLPWILQAIEGPILQDQAATAAAGHVLPDISDLAIMVACAGVGWLVAARLRIPAATLVGPLLLSAAVHLTGVTAASVPQELVAAAQVVVGASIGCRFAGSEWPLLRKAFVLSLGLIALLLVLCIAGAWLLHVATGVPLANCVLAFAPGGLAEMTLIALAMDIDPAFVATHHVIRIILLVLFAPIAYRLLYGPPPRTAD